jgi:hypothetical protein
MREEEIPWDKIINILAELDWEFSDIKAKPKKFM